MTKSNLAQFGENVVEFGENYVTEVKNVFMQDAVRDSVFGQLIIIAVAVAIAPNHGASAFILVPADSFNNKITRRDIIPRDVMLRRFVSLSFCSPDTRFK